MQKMKNNKINELKLYEFNNLKITCDIKNYKPLVRKAIYCLMIYITKTISRFNCFS